jgi:hypothetical protein
MPIEHRYIQELEEIENNQLFCQVPIAANSNILIIGTFNPNDADGALNNHASWFYGRNQSKFWRYFPISLTGESMHILDEQVNIPTCWKEYCTQNGIVIIDLVKRIESNQPLQNFSDREVNDRINHNLDNVEYFNVVQAFAGITFDRVIYSLIWSDNQVGQLIAIRNIINQQLLDNNCIQGIHQIKYAKTPSRGDAFESWNRAANL